MSGEERALQDAASCSIDLIRLSVDVLHVCV